MAGDPTTDIALVSGANKGIGKEISRRLGAAGRTVIMGSRDERRGQQAADELRGQGHDVHLVVLDVTDEESITSAAKQIDQEFGRLDVLVNNAGVWLEGVTPCDQVTVEEMRRTYEVNVFGVAAVTNAMLPLLRRSANAKIVNMASPLGSLTLRDDPASPVASMGLLAYNSSKTALNSLTLLYANFLRDSGIKVNSASPGFVATDLNGPGRRGPPLPPHRPRPLARHEMAAVLSVIADRLPNLCLAEPPTRRRSIPLRDFTSIPVALG